MIDTFTFYKKLLAAGIPELQAKAIQKAAFKYAESISAEYKILLDSLTTSGLNQDQAELISDLVKSQSH
jgi:hypothetical protein